MDGMNREPSVFRAETTERVDKAVSSVLGLSRSLVEELCGEGKILVGGRPVRKNHKLHPGDKVSVEIPEPKEMTLLPTPMELDILYEDDDLLIVNKPRGLVVHPAPGNYEGTLVNGLLAYDRHLSTINGTYRPGIVHRIDKDTSGILVVAKNDESHRNLAEQFKAHSISRKYLALVLGTMTERTGEVNLPIGRDPGSRVKMAVVKDGKPAVTRYRVLEQLEGYTLVECVLETGRTHQIRVHMAYLKHPVAGDPLYGRRTPEVPLEGQFLHAFHLGIRHPRTGEELVFDAPVPGYFTEVLERLRAQGKERGE